MWKPLIAASLVLLSTRGSALSDEPSPPPLETARTALDASAILRPEFVRGSHFSVRPSVPTKNGVNHFTIDSDFGVFTAEGNTALTQRIAEIEAIAKLQKISRSDSYKKALAAAAKSPLLVAKSAVEHPVDTAGNVSKGLWKMLNGAGQTIKEIGHGRTTSPYEDSVAEDAIGFGGVKRELALKLGVDPYSKNEVLQKQLKSVAWAAYGGHMTIAGALLPVGGAVGLTLKSINTGGKSLAALRDLSPADLRLRNLKILLAMGIDRRLANAFLDNPALSPTHQTLIVDSLEQLKGVPGRDKFIRLAEKADDESDAIRYQRSAQLLAQINLSQPIDLLSAYHGLPLALTRGGVLVVPLEWDYAQWTHGSRKFLDALKAGRIGDRRFSSIRVYLSGDASPIALEAARTGNVALTQRALPGPLK